MFPRVIINTKKYRHNLENLVEKCHSFGLSVMVVTKVFCADQNLVDIINDVNADYIADSRILNFKSMKSSLPKVLLRLPSHGEISDVVRYTDISLNSEIATLRLLSSEAKVQNRQHGIILMIDLGDLREGVFEETEVFRFAKEVIKLPNLVFRGIGVNLTCYGGVIPTTNTLEKLVDYKVKIENKFNVSLDIISGGNSSNIELMLNNGIPLEINNIRLGESIVLGRETAYGDFIENTYDDVFTLEADIIEVKRKPSIPIGQIGMNAFGKIPKFEDKGDILRAILAIGKQDVDYKEIIPFDTIKPIGSSSDHIIVDITDSHNMYEVGDTMLFKLTYSSVLSLMTSKYVSKTYE